MNNDYSERYWYRHINTDKTGFRKELVLINTIADTEYSNNINLQSLPLQYNLKQQKTV